MKSIKQTLLFAIILCGCISCRNKAENDTSAGTEEATEEMEDSLYQARGVVIDATMNGFTMVTPENDTLYISTMDQNLALEGGLSLGDTLDVSYTITEDEPGINIVSTAQKVH